MYQTRFFHLTDGCLDCRKLSRRVTGLVALAINLEETYFEEPGTLDFPIATLRLLLYSGQHAPPGYQLKGGLE